MKLKPVKPKKGKVDGPASLIEAKVPMKDAGLIEVLRRFTHRSYACLVPFELTEGRAKAVVVYDTTSLVAYPAYLAMPVDSDQFIVMVESLLRAFDEVERLGVSADYLLFDTDVVYMNAVRGSVSFIVGSDYRGKGTSSAFEVFCALGSEPKPVSYEDRELMKSYVEGLDGVRSGGLPALRRYARAFVSDYRGSEVDADETIKTPSQRFSREIFYDVRSASEGVEQRGVHARVDTTTVRREPVENKVMVRLQHSAVGSSWDVTRFPYTFGSDARADCRIKSNQWVSRMHARLTVEGNRVYLEDMDSTNGTSVNGIRMASGARCMLASGDVFELVNERFEIAIRFR